MLEKFGFVFLPMFAMCLVAVPAVVMWLESRDAKRAALERAKAESTQKVGKPRSRRVDQGN